MTFAGCVFFRWFSHGKGIGYWSRISLPLFVPYVVISIAYLILRWREVKEIPLLLWGAIFIASVWFLLGPHLVGRFMRSFLGLSNDTRYAPKLKEWFQRNQASNYKIYARAMTFLSPVLILAVVPVLIRYPEILSSGACLTHGINDPFFWLVLLFLCWLLVYCSNAISVILMMIAVVRKITRLNVLEFNPTLVFHHDNIGLIIRFCNMVVSYMCSGLFFLPLAIYYLQQSSYPLWFTGIFAVYSVFLLVSLAYPQLALKAYVKRQSLHYLAKEQGKYFSLLQREHKQKPGQTQGIEDQLRLYNMNLYLQELKTVCFLNVKQDAHSVIAITSVLVTFMMSLISGLSDYLNILDVFNK